MHTEGEPAVARGCARRDPLRALDDGHDLDRAAGRRGAGGAGGGSSSTCGATGRPAATSSRGPGRPGTTRSSSPSTRPVRRARLRDVRNGLTLPPVAVAGAPSPRGRCTRVVGRPAHHRAAGVRLAQPVRRHRGRAGRPDVRPGRDVADLAWLRETWPGPLVVKGVQTVADARAWSSTRAPTRSSCPTTAGVSSTARRHRSSACRPSWTRSASGPRCTSTAGSCPAATSSPAVALGARAVLVGRAYLYGLMAGGERGVQRAAEILDHGGARHDGAARRHARRRPSTRTGPAATGLR